MTEAELLAAAEAAAKLTTISQDEFLRRVSVNPDYAYKATNWYKALSALEAIKHLETPPPPPPPGIDLSPGRSWIVMAQEPSKALMYPAYYGIAFTADPAYERPSLSLVSQLRSRGQRVRSWCDCHATMPAAAITMATSFGLDGWIGEGESAYAFDNAYAAGAKIMVGNLSALRVDQKALIATGKVLWTNELYLNDDPTLATRENWENLPVAGRTIACYGGYPFQNYLNLGKFSAHVDSVFDPGMTDDDRRLVP